MTDRPHVTNVDPTTFNENSNARQPSPPAPRTAAGRAAFELMSGLGPKLDTITRTAREWRETILAIEAEAAAERRATVERIRERLTTNAGMPVREIHAILDEEAAR